MAAKIGTDNYWLAPASKGTVLTKSDSTTFNPTKGVWVGGAGAINVTFAGQTTQTLISGVLAGTYLPISITQLYSTSTTATLVVALY